MNSDHFQMLILCLFFFVHDSNAMWFAYDMNTQARLASCNLGKSDGIVLSESDSKIYLHTVVLPPHVDDDGSRSTDRTLVIAHRKCGNPGTDVWLYGLVVKVIDGEENLHTEQYGKLDANMPSRLQ